MKKESSGAGAVSCFRRLHSPGSKYSCGALNWQNLSVYSIVWRTETVQKSKNIFNSLTAVIIQDKRNAACIGKKIVHPCYRISMQ